MTDVIWTNFSRSNVTASGNDLTIAIKSPGAWDHGSSTHSYGSFTFQVTTAASTHVSMTSSPTLDYLNAEYDVYFMSSGAFEGLQSGVFTAISGSWSAGQYFKLEIDSSSCKFYQSTDSGVSYSLVHTFSNTASSTTYKLLGSGYSSLANHVFNAIDSTPTPPPPPPPPGSSGTLLPPPPIELVRF